MTKTHDPTAVSFDQRVTDSQTDGQTRRQ